ncbi:MAG: NB-ARC domain-containing protein [Cyanobacteria bacterium P01_G01_bin.19]
MATVKQKRNRGVLLTKKGLEQLEVARSDWEYKENYGERCTYEKISEITNLDINTIKKILCTGGKVDKRSIEKFYRAFGLKLDEEFYTKFNPKIREDWGEAVTIDHFFGRKTEIDTLTSWVIKDHCRLVTLQGMGGIGKTTLSIQFAQQLKSKFDCVVWKSLRDAPSAADIIGELIEFLSKKQETEETLPKRISSRITKLIGYMRSQRCLVIIDNAESLLDTSNRAGKYRQGYEEYSELFARIGATSHSSCLMITTREKTREIAALEGKKTPVRSLRLGGLTEGVDEIFQIKGLDASKSEVAALSDRFGGNPLALKVVATTIQDLFAGDINEFLHQEQAVFGDIQDILEQQFLRLSDLEQKIMYWLAIAREPISLKELQSDLVSTIPAIKLLEALESLSRRSLIERNAACFTQQPVVMEYVTSRLIQISCAEIINQKIEILQNHSLIKATAKDYIKENQNRLILQPVIDELLNTLTNKQALETQLQQILATLRETPAAAKGYTAGNILNLLHHMEADLTGLDFSNLCVWQADLRQAQLHNVNFQNADLSKSVFAENFGGIWSVAFSPNGQYLAAGDTKGDIIMRRVADGQPVMRFTGHTAWVVSLDFSPDGKTLASSSCDCTARLWDVANGQCLHSLEEHEHEVWSVAFSPDGQTLATGCDDNKARLWNVETGKCIRVFQEHTDCVLSVVFGLDGQELITGSQDTTIKLWNFKTGECEKTFEGHTDGVRSVSFDLDRKILASGGADRTIRLWDIETEECLKVFQGHSNMIMSVTFCTVSNLLASSSIGHKVRLWDIETEECLRVFQGHSNVVNSVKFHPKGNILASGSYDQSIKLWNINTYGCVETWQGYSNQALSVVFSPDGTTLFSGGHDRQIRLWNIATGKVIKTLQGHTNWIFSLAFNTKHNFLASSSGDRAIKFWDIQTGKVIKTLVGHEAAIRSIAFSTDNQILASASDDRSIRLWSINTGKTLAILTGHQAEILSIAFSGDSKTLASVSFDNTLKLWDVLSGKCIRTLEDSWFWSVAFSPDNKTMVSSSGDQTIRIWNRDASKCQKIMKEDIGYSQIVCFSNNGQVIASCNGENNIRLWLVKTGECLRTLPGHLALINSIAFSPDDFTLISSSEDETIKIWDVKTGECLNTLRAKNPYEGMSLDNARGLNQTTTETLKALGAIDNKFLGID